MNIPIQKSLKAAVWPLVLAVGPLAGLAAEKPLRPPAVPLVACDPYFSIWSMSDQLNDDTTRHWTGKPHTLTSLVRIDGKPYRLMGSDPKNVPPLPQVSLQVLPTRTIYEFEGAGVRVTLTFTTASLPYDLDILSRPVTYLTWECRASDGKPHAISLYYDNSAELVVNVPAQQVVWSVEKNPDLNVLRMGSKEQRILGLRGDDLRIDWGYLLVAAPKAIKSQQVLASQQCRETFAGRGTLPDRRDTRQPRAANDDPVVAAFMFDLGNVADKPVTRWLMLAYDDLYAIQYFRQNLRPYWRRKVMEAADLLRAAARDYTSLQNQCRAFDTELMADLRQIGGEKYAQLCALAYRQVLAGNKLAADANGQPLLFPKENFSNGCIGTVDVIYPMAPFFLLFGPSLSKAMLVSNLDYASSPRWKFPFAPHDLGTYPQANGQVYGGGERTEQNQMPVEETGNMLLLVTALAQMEGHAQFAAKYWPVLVKWAEYLKAKGFDPENQLCTDDFAGHLAHNVNLSAKAIVGLGAFAKLCDMRGDKETATAYRDLAKEFAAKWVKEADDGDHFRLAFDRQGTWSQKYNLVWDRILGLNLFGDQVLRKEMDYYKQVQKRYGLPLDNRKEYTKLDWTVWTATLTGAPADFEALIGPVYDFLQETPDRVPMTDWYMTHNAKKVGFQARPVVGGVFIKFLYDQNLWQKWAARDRTKAANWAPMPQPPRIEPTVHVAITDVINWRYTTEKPADDWFKPEFDASTWKEGAAGFGTKGTPGSRVRTEWNTPEIWLRREFTLPEGNWKNLQLFIHHDEDAQVYINGVLAAAINGYTTAYENLPMSEESKAAIKPGKNSLAVHCVQTEGGQYIDVGLVNVIEGSK